MFKSGILLRAELRHVSPAPAVSKCRYYPYLLIMSFFVLVTIKAASQEAVDNSSEPFRQAFARPCEPLAAFNEWHSLSTGFSSPPSRICVATQQGHTSSTCPIANFHHLVRYKIHRLSEGTC